MHNRKWYILCFVHVLFSISNISCRRLLFTNKWIVHIKGESADIAKIALKHGFILNGKIYNDVYRLKKIGIPSRTTLPNENISNRLRKESGVLEADQIRWKMIYRRSMIAMNDRLWNDMWYVKKSTHPSMRVLEAWNAGYTGRGIVIGIVDDGVEIDHPDLKENINKELSVDFFDGDKDPSPVDLFQNHGTKCAGAAAAVCNNSICGCGIAFSAQIAGIKNNNGYTTSDIEAQSVTHKMDKIAIYSNSWGESGSSEFGGPDDIVKSALVRGISSGRNSKGSIYVWASGNGSPDDNCNADGYANSVYTIAIASVNHGGYPASYGELCSAILAATYSQGRTSIVTTDTNQKCDKTFTGTSASTPVAAALIGLALQANGKLSWRDVQHIIVSTSSMSGLTDSHVVTNGAGKTVSHYFGFGLMNAEEMVNAAKNWTFVSDQRICSERVEHSNLNVGQIREVISNITTSECNQKIKHLEHVLARVTFSASKRGEVEFFLTSPSGTTSTLLTKRRNDKSGIRKFSWEFMSVHYWGEHPYGVWSLKMRIKDVSCTGSLNDWKLTFFGTNDRHDLERQTYKMENSFSNAENTSNSLIAAIVLSVLFVCVPIAIYGVARHRCRCKKKTCPVKESCTSVKAEEQGQQHSGENNEEKRRVEDNQSFAVVTHVVSE